VGVCLEVVGLYYIVLVFFVFYRRRKPAADREARVIHTVRGVGYVLREDPDGSR
jgi:DNA-binding response OmpR family regulator